MKSPEKPITDSAAPQVHPCAHVRSAPRGQVLVRRLRTRSSGNSNLTHLVLLRFVPWDPSLAGPATLAPSKDDLKDHQRAHESDTQGRQDQT
jgi:hypothetical protein